MPRFINAGKSSAFQSCSAKLFFDVHFEIRLCDCIERNLYAAVGAIFKRDFFVLYAQDCAAEVPLSVDSATGSQFRFTSGKPLVISVFIKTSLEPRRRNLQRIRSVYEILDVEDGAHIETHFGTILVSDTGRLINKDANDRFILGSRHFGVY